MSQSMLIAKLMKRAANETRAEVEAEADKAQAEIDAQRDAAADRIQDLDNDATAGVQATATTKIDVQ